MSVRVICDSTADLDPAFRAAHPVTVVPLRVIIGDEEFRDGVDIQPADLYARMRDAGVTARTSQPTPAEFEAVFRTATDDGAAAVCTTISAEMSGTYAAAMQARAALADRSIEVIDSRTVAIGHYAVAAAAVAAAERGEDAQAVAAAARHVAGNVKLLFTVETLEYLRRGGRIGGARALLGSMLDIKPILETRDGRIEPVDRVRTYRRALEHVAQAAEAAAASWGGATFIVGHAGMPTAGTALTQHLTAACPGQPVTTVEVGPVIGAHGGPGAAGVAFYAA